MSEPRRVPPDRWLELATFRIAFVPDRKAVRAELEEHLEDKVQRCFPTPPKRGTPSFGDYVVITGAIMRERAYLEWLAACTALYQSES